MPTMKMTKRAVEALPARDASGKQTLYWAEGTATPGRHPGLQRLGKQVLGMPGRLAEWQVAPHHPRPSCGADA